MHSLAILDPGHFHAALPLRERNPRLDPVVHVFAREGQELERFLAMVGRFNARAEAPTAWELRVRRCADPLAALLAERPASVAVLAGRNRGKLAAIAALARAGIHVLADKPWVVEPGDVARLDGLDAAPGRVADMMTERFEPFAALFASLASEVAGPPAPGEGPALEKSTVHHLAKLVDGQALVRPAWYFDVAEQGEGVIDVTTHLVDQALLIAGAAQRPLALGEAQVLAARRWATTVPAADFTAITRTPAFPPALAGAVRDGALQLMANGSIDLVCRGLSARVQVEWRLRSDDPAGDHHASRYRGADAVLELDGTAAGGFQRLLPPAAGALAAPAPAPAVPGVVSAPGAARPRTAPSALPRAACGCSQLLVRPRHDRARAALARWAAARPGVTLADAEGGAVAVRPAHVTTHEQHFAEVLDGYLNGIESPRAAWQHALLDVRCRLLAQALALARR